MNFFFFNLLSFKKKNDNKIPNSGPPISKYYSMAQTILIQQLFADLALTCINDIDQTALHALQTEVAQLMKRCNQPIIKETYILFLKSIAEIHVANKLFYLLVPSNINVATAVAKDHFITVYKWKCMNPSESIVIDFFDDQFTDMGYNVSYQVSKDG